MNAQKYTQKSLEAIQAAQQLTIENQNQQIEQIHLLASLIRQENGLAPQLLRKMGVTVESLDAAVLQELGKLPRVTGSGREADRYYVARPVDEALNRAEKLADEIGANMAVKVVTNDSLIRLSALRSGVLRMPVKEFVNELLFAEEHMAGYGNGKTRN